MSLWATQMLNGCSETSRSLEDTSEGTYMRAATEASWPQSSMGSAVRMLHALSPVLCRVHSIHCIHCIQKTKGRQASQGVP